MRWQKVARVFVAAIGIGTAAAIYLLTRERPAPNAPALNLPADPAAKMQSGAGQDERYQGDRLLGTLTYDDVRTYEGNRIVWQAFEYRLQDGTVLSADRVEARGAAAAGDKPDELTLTGNVRLQTANGTTLTGASGTYSEVTGQANIPGETAFSRGRMNGTGTGGTYERDTGTFRLLADTKITMAAEDESVTPLEATAVSMTFTPDVKAMLLDQQARLERADETLSGDRATLFLTDDESAFRLIELRGNARVTPASGQDSALPEMEATDIDLAFYEGGQALQRARLVGEATMTDRGERGRRSIEGEVIDFSTAPDGRTLTRLEAQPRNRNERIVVRLPGGAGTPSRTITASTLVAGGDGRGGLTSALFQGAVEFVESGAGRGARASERRVGKSERLTLALKGQLDVIDQARFERNVSFTSGTLEGSGDVGVYRATVGEMDLSPGMVQPRRRASVVDADAGVNVEAAEIITVYLGTGDLHARGDVTTATSGSKAKGASTSIFNAAEPIYGSGTEFRYHDATMAATYRGTATSLARLQQKNSVVSAQQIEFFREAQDLKANGNVDSTFEMAPTARPGRPAETGVATYRVTADALVYTETARTATYTGSARLRSTETDTTAGTMALMLSSTARALERLEARETVEASLEGGRRARGDRLVYDAPRDVYELEGKPLTIINREQDGTCYGQEGTFARFEGALGAPDFPADRNADGGAPRRSIPCPAPAAK